jgi:hypothetical protein
MLRNRALFFDALPAGFDGEFCWDFLKPAWGATRIRPTDIDAMVERHGAYLLFETKAPGKAVEDGQRIALEGLACLRPFTIVFCAKRCEQIDGFDVWARGRRTHFFGNADTLVAWCTAWLEEQDARFASGRRYP